MKYRRRHSFSDIADALCAALALTVSLASGKAHPAPAGNEPGRFIIEAQPLPDALDRFVEQSGLQVVYDHESVVGKHSPAIGGTFRPGEVLDLLLANSGLAWKYLDEGTVALGSTANGDAASPGEGQKGRRGSPASPHGNMPTLSVIKVTGDPHRVLPDESSRSAFGFDKPLLETPRSVSFISQESIDLFGLSAVEDLVRVVPSAYTTTRFGIQGSVDIRGIPADTYFRGMKRLSLQGHGRSVLAATDTIEIVRGPPSPLYGLGKIGGYTNVVPKSGRAATGGYLDEFQGFIQGIAGSYSRNEWSAGLGGPFAAAGKRGGFYLYGLFEDSASYTRSVPIDQRVAQGALSVDNAIGPFRLETGGNYEVSKTAGALTSRLTQDLVGSGRYLRGTPLVNLDLNGNGRIGYLEMQTASPVNGALGNSNQPLIQTWPWPTDGNGVPLPLGQFPKIGGIPQSMYDYLVAHPEVDPTGLLRAQGSGGPLPVSGYVPAGMVLDPGTVGYDKLDLRRAAAFEKDLRAEFIIGFIDLIYDTHPDFTIKNQLFFDRMDQFKISNQPFSPKQEVYAVEERLTVTRRLSHLPPWARINTLAALNMRKTVSQGRSMGGDYSNHRTDAMAPTWTDGGGGMTPNSTFANALEHPDLYDDGIPWTSIYRSELTEYGLGLLLDIDILSDFNFLLGGRFDISEAKNEDYAGSFNQIAGTSAQPGMFRSENAGAQAWDHGTSLSASMTYRAPYNVRPYITFNQTAVALDGNNNSLENAVIETGHIGSAQLTEIGVKASLLGDTLFMSMALFRQSRTDVEEDDDASVLTAYASATTTRGMETELKWVPLRNLFVSLYALHQTTEYAPNIGGTLLVDARTLGFVDVVDPASGAIMYPAEAFLYGGRARLILPDGVQDYRKKQGNPETQIGMSFNYQRESGLGFTLSGNYFSSTCSGRLCLVRLPSAHVMNAGVFFDAGPWSVKFDIMNFLDERYFRARTGDTLGDALVQAMPDRRWQITARHSF